MLGPATDYSKDMDRRRHDMEIRAIHGLAQADQDLSAQDPDRLYGGNEIPDTPNLVDSVRKFRKEMSAKAELLSIQWEPAWTKEELETKRVRGTRNDASRKNGQPAQANANKKPVANKRQELPQITGQGSPVPKRLTDLASDASSHRQRGSSRTQLPRLPGTHDSQLHIQRDTSRSPDTSSSILAQHHEEEEEPNVRLMGSQFREDPRKMNDDSSHFGSTPGELSAYRSAIDDSPTWEKRGGKISQKHR